MGVEFSLTIPVFSVIFVNGGDMHDYRLRWVTQFGGEGRFDFPGTLERDSVVRQSSELAENLSRNPHIKGFLLHCPGREVIELHPSTSTPQVHEGRMDPSYGTQLGDR